MSASPESTKKRRKQIIDDVKAMLDSYTALDSAIWAAVSNKRQPYALVWENVKCGCCLSVTALPQPHVGYARVS